MDPAKKPPLVFANRVIRMLVDHLVDEHIQVLPNDYTAMRVTFRRLGGAWEKLTVGDIKTARLLAHIVTTWGGMPGRIKETEMG